MTALKCYADNTDTVVNLGLVTAGLVGVLVGIVIGQWTK